MARLFLILIILAASVAIAAVLYSIWTVIVETSARHLRPATGTTGETEMASNGIKKAAYIALIVVLFGVASGWLGEM
ncbi:MAG: hypothetical protein P8N14_01160 [Sulfitobacter sp.]|jgi:cell division protein FtsX|nr:hypothetical protein [Sulfitobacter sp.]